MDDNGGQIIEILHSEKLLPESKTLQTEHVKWIGIRPGRGAPMLAVEAVPTGTDKG